MPFARKFSILCLLTLVMLSATGQEQYVKVYGNALSAEDSSELQVPILYEKLPYYDDMGMVSSSASGAFEFYLVDGLEYNITIRKDGFETLSKGIKVSDTGGDESMSINFYVSPIAQAEPEPTPEPEPVEEEIFVLQNLIFSSGSEVIQRSSYSALDEFAAWLKARPSYIVQLEGHTDISGNPDANMRLSQARVESVKEYIRKKGIKKARVLTKAFGGTQPLSTERTDAAKRANRRVEVRVVAR
ncbi:MAG: OmpA family protein [Cytophagales bacterium]|nr:OmpA family protein [Cytophagales bacterium]